MRFVLEFSVLLPLELFKLLLLVPEVREGGVNFLVPVLEVPVPAVDELLFEFPLSYWGGGFAFRFPWLVFEPPPLANGFMLATRLVDGLFELLFPGPP